MDRGDQLAPGLNAGGEDSLGAWRVGQASLAQCHTESLSAHAANATVIPRFRGSSTLEPVSEEALL